MTAFDVGFGKVRIEMDGFVQVAAHVRFRVQVQIHPGAPQESRCKVGIFINSLLVFITGCTETTLGAVNLADVIIDIRSSSAPGLAPAGIRPVRFCNPFAARKRRPAS